MQLGGDTCAGVVGYCRYVNGGRAAYTHAAADFDPAKTAVKLFTQGSAPIIASNVSVHGFGCGWVADPPTV